jgi:short-subunit dehydrogenase
MKAFKDKYGDWALVTGASSGIGNEYATHIASQGLNIVLVARNEKKLRDIGKKLISKYEVNVEVIAADLTIKSDIETLFKKTSDLEIGLLVNNAGREDSNHFLKIPVKQHLNTIDLNIKTPLILTHHFGAKMIDRKTEVLLICPQ